MRSERDIREIAYDYVIGTAQHDEEWEYLFTALFERLSTDDVVDWIVGDLLSCDEKEVKEAFGENAEAVLDYYDAHCR